MKLAWFQSDNVTGVSPEIWNAMKAAGEGEAAPYGDDTLTVGLAARFSELFEKECIVCPVTSGIAANALALSLIVGPLESAISHTHAHVATSEGGAFEFFTQGGRLVTLPGRDGKLASGELEKFLAGINRNYTATIPPRGMTITQATERGTLYSIDEIRALGSVAKQFGLRVHMDGARIANAIVALGCRPADLTWHAGVDLLSFGATKNGAMMADAIVIFDKTLATSLGQRRRRSGQSSSKMRFMAAQLHAYVTDDLWLNNARVANGAAKRLADGLAGLPGLQVAYPVEANMIFLRAEPDALGRLSKAGIDIRPSRQGDERGKLYRMVTSFLANDAQVDELVGGCRRALS
jgi:threonine aldolase